MVVLDKQIKREHVIDKLTENGIGTGPGSVAGHCVSFYQEKFSYKGSDLPTSNWLNSHGLALPLYCGMTDEDVSMCTNELHKISRRMK
jgi:dTDP-4-amino-4,6-dideoxygalactose transaminase